MKTTPRPGPAGKTFNAIFLTIVVCGFALIAAIYLLLHASLDVVAKNANTLDNKKTVQAVAAAIDTSKVGLSSLVKTNSVWDDAVREVYSAHPDQDWLYSSIGALATEGGDYDGAYVVDENGKVIWGYSRGRASSNRDTRFLGNGFQSVFRTYRTKDATIVEPGTGLTKTTEGLSLVSVGLIQPSSRSVNLPLHQFRYMVMTRHLTPAVLSKLGKTFGINNLCSAGPNDRPSHARSRLLDASGQPLGNLAWTPDLPGATAAREASPQIVATMVIVTALIVLFVLVIARFFHWLRQDAATTRQLALTDSLTGLPNRRALLERLMQVGEKVGTEDVAVSVTIINIDAFKDVNDAHGHEVGDGLLQALAVLFTQFVPKGGLLARLGGDEFALLIVSRGAGAAAGEFVRNLLAALTAPIQIGPHPLRVDATVGVATLSVAECRASELLRKADLALQNAKVHQKGGVLTYAHAMDDEREKRRQIAAEIRLGLERNEFDVAYQVIVNAKSKRVEMVEALLRWPRRPAGALGPDVFIEIAEETGLIHALGLFVLRRACEDIQPFDGLAVSVNVSPSQFRDPRFEGNVAQIVHESGLSTDRLELEVTEGYLIDNPQRAREALANFKAMGLSIALDDFGTGYTSIGYLRTYGFDKIKIDRSLVSALGSDPKASVLIQGAIFIADGLSMEVTAEGVETLDEAKLLDLAGCHKLQGFCFGRPISVGELRLKVQTTLCEPPVPGRAK